MKKTLTTILLSSIFLYSIKPEVFAQQNSKQDSVYIQTTGHLKKYPSLENLIEDLRKKVKKDGLEKKKVYAFVRTTFDKVYSSER